MTRFIFILFFLIISCKENSNELKNNSSKFIETRWFAWKDYYFEKEIYFNHNENDKIEFHFDEKINTNDSVKKIGTKYIYSTRPTKVGDYLVSGKIKINDSTEINFSTQILVLPEQKPIIYNISKSNEIKLNTENEINIIVGFPLDQIELQTNNGKIYKRNNSVFIVPNKTGECIISLKHILPEYYDKTDLRKFEDFKLKVVE